MCTCKFSFKRLTQRAILVKINVGREVLAQLSTPMALNFSDATSSRNLDRSALLSTGVPYLRLLYDLDFLLGHCEAFRLTAWTSSARRLAEQDVAGGVQHDCFSPILGNKSQDGDDGSCKHFYEWNARCQVTTWNPTPMGASQVPGGPIDYSSKHWNGLIRSYYAKRVTMLLDQALYDEYHKQPLNDTEIQRAFAKYAYEWTTASDDSSEITGMGSQDVQSVSKSFLLKYSHWFSSCGHDWSES